MSEKTPDPKDFVAALDSNARKSPTRVVFVTRRTSAQVRVTDEDQVQTYPEVLFRAIVAIEVLTIALVGVSLLFNAPLEGIANPLVTPNPAKAPWYFLGLQEMLHYFPPVVAGVLAPGLVVMALIVIPYFNINIEAEGLFLKDRKRRLLIFYLVAAGLSLFLLFLPEQPGHAVSQLHGIPAALGSVGLLGDHGRFEHRCRGAGDGQQDSFPHARRQHGERQCSAALLRAALHDSATGCDPLCRSAFLADS